MENYTKESLQQTCEKLSQVDGVIASAIYLEGGEHAYAAREEGGLPWREICQEGTSMYKRLTTNNFQVMTSDATLVVDRKDNLVFAVVTQLGHPVRKSLRRTLNKVAKDLKKQPPSQKEEVQVGAQTL